MGFKDIIQADISNVFFNTEEFAEMHSYGNTQITAIIDDEDMIAKYASEYEFLSKGSHMVLAPVSAFAIKPQMHAAVSFDGDLYVLNEIKEMDGVYILFLDSNRG